MSLYGYIYKITNNIDGKIYIGQKKSSFIVEDYYGSGLYITRAIKKYGVNNFTRDILEWCESKEALNEKEIYWISKLDATNRRVGYNISTGGNGGNLGPEVIQKMAASMRGKKHTEATKKKMSESRKGHTTSEQTRKKISDANKGEKCYWYGKKHSAETLEKMRQSHKGHSTSAETRKKIGDAHRGKQRSAEARLKNSLAHTGERHPNWGKHLPQETREKIGNANRGRKMSQEHCEKLKKSFENRIYNNVCRVCGNTFISKSANKKTCDNCRKE